jgi:hypothetical protein
VNRQFEFKIGRQYQKPLTFRPGFAARFFPEQKKYLEYHLYPLVPQHLDMRPHFSDNSLIYMMPKFQPSLKSRPSVFRAKANDLRHFRDSYSPTLGHQ